ncbi:protoporphyrinogen oxidase [[Mycoplasma] phocae]|uniref:peptide chain release factor N(5)-glutamine methyltransferase n=1 Tax=[Mycoplasma] phocae TaxID=142651 RepID=A0A2Z5IPS1_9BACT|nr:peptide chain release factor N(5)-glutamine methyltransferase [[Mycoplasma] phocae]AXE60733.1 protoporphyrinogen oxidase [[Mycoplasma] phocae]
MISENELLHEKIRYDLPLTISKKEKKLLKKNVPCQKIIGYQIMQNVHIDLRYKVLIPRYETEELILFSYNFINQNTKILDLGCGSGFIGIAIAKNKNTNNITMVDISRQSIKQSKYNAKINNVNPKIVRSNWFKKIYEKFDLIICNPPYLNKKSKFSKSLRHEPKRALFAKNEGLKEYQFICKNAIKYLNYKGMLIFEIDPYVSVWFKSNFPHAKIVKDINQKERIVVLQYDDLLNY